MSSKNDMMVKYYMQKTEQDESPTKFMQRQLTES